MNQECPICLNPISKPFYAHKNNSGKLHPFHKRCLMKYIKDKQNPKCPVCRVSISKPNINRSNSDHNNADRSNGVIMNNNKPKQIGRNNLGIGRQHFLSYQPSMRGYFVIDTNTGAPAVNNGVAQFVNRNAFKSLLPNNRADRHYIGYNTNNNTHYIMPMNSEYL